MKHHFPAYTGIACAVALLLASCAATTGLNQEERYYLSSNEVHLNAGKEIKGSDITPYIKQAGAIKLRKSKRVEFNRSLVDASVESIKDHLEYLGYYNSTVDTKVSAKNHWVTVYYDVTPGVRYKISEIRYRLPQGSVFEADFLEDVDNISVKVGDYLSEASLEEETVRSEAHMRTKGYFNFNKTFYTFEADTLGGPDATILEMRVDEYARNQDPETARPHEVFTIGNVTFSYPRELPFNDNILKELNTIKPGAVYNEQEINKTYTRLSALKLFSGVGIELSEADSNKVNCAITLTPSKLQGFKVNWEASSNSSGLIGISPQLSYYHKNIFHGGEWLNLGFMGNFQHKFNDSVHSDEFGLSAGLSLPRFLGAPYTFFNGTTIPRTEINASYNYQSRPEYTRHIISTSFGYSFSLAKGFSYQIYPLQLNMVRLKNIDPDFRNSISSNPFMRYSYQDHFDAGLGATFYYTSNTDLVPKTTYFYNRLVLDMSGNVLGMFKNIMKKGEDNHAMVLGAPFSQYIRAEYTIGKTWRMGAEQRMALATRLMAGAGFAYGNSSSLPFEKQFYSGGANSLRGWRSRSVGPGSAPVNTIFSIPSQTGDVKLEANVEFRFPIVWKIEGALFAEAGNVWSMNSDNAPDRLDKDFYKVLAADWGTGLRVDLSFIVLRLDAGFRLHDPAREIGSRWLTPGQWLKSDGFAVHFGVGYPF